MHFIPIVAFLRNVLLELSKCDVVTRDYYTIRYGLVAKIVTDDCMDTGWIGRQFFTGSSVQKNKTTSTFHTIENPHDGFTSHVRIHS